MLRLGKIIKENKLFLFIFLLGLLLRFIGTNPGYNKFHSDEDISYSAAVSMIKNHNIDPLRYDYPGMVPMINYLFFKVLFIPLYWLKYFITHIGDFLDGVIRFPISNTDYKRIFQIEILGEREVNALIWGRYVTAFVSSCNLILVYLLGKLFFSKRTGLIAMLILALNFRAVTNSHIGLPDTYNAFFLLLAILSIYSMFKKPTLQRYVIAGITIGLSVSTKYQTFTALSFIIAHLLNSLKIVKNDKTNLNTIIRRVVIWPILAGLSAFVAFALINPYFFIHIEESIKWLIDVSGKYSMGKNTVSLFPFYYYYHHDLGPILTLLIPLAILLSFITNFYATFITLGFVIPFVITMIYLSVGGFYVRNFITITPLIIIFIANLFNILTKRIKYGNFFLFLILIPSLYIPGRNAFINSYNYIKPWNYDLIVERSKEFIPDGAKVASHPFDPLPPEKNVLKTPFVTDSSYSLAEFRESSSQLALVNMDWASNNFYGWMTSSYPDTFKYFNKPVDQMRNTFWGLSIEEMMDYVLTSAYKPWQAPEAALFLVDIPYEKEQKYEQIEKYEFVNDLEGWNIIFKDDLKAEYISHLADSKISKTGSIQISEGGGTFGIIRLSSPVLDISDFKTIRVKSYLKSDKPLALNKRNVFIRIDFYEDSAEGEIGKHFSLSERYYGEDWKYVTAIRNVPVGAKYIRVSIQSSGLTNSKHYIDSVLIEGSKDYAFDNKQYENIGLEEYVDLLYPNSHGNM